MDWAFLLSVEHGCSIKTCSHLLTTSVILLLTVGKGDEDKVKLYHIAKMKKDNNYKTKQKILQRLLDLITSFFMSSKI